MRSVTTISIGAEDREFLDASGLKISAFLHEKIREEKERNIEIQYKKQIQLLDSEILKLEDRISLCIRFIQSKNLFDDYRGFINSIEKPKEATATNIRKPVL